MVSNGFVQKLVRKLAVIYTSSPEKNFELKLTN